MPCEAMQAAWLQAQYAGEGPSEALHVHFAQCAVCQAFRARQGQLDVLLAQEPGIEPGLGFDTRFFARLAKERVHEPRRRWLRWLFGLVPVAAAFALLFLLRKPNLETALPLEEVALARDLELVEALPVVQRLDEIEAYETLVDVDPADLEAALSEPAP